jgi:Na+/melibiose symporter-like transporter
VRLALQDRDFRVLVASAGLFFLASVVNAALAIHFVTYYAGVARSSAMSVFLFAFYAGAVAGVPVWLRLGCRADKHRLYAAGTLATATVVLAAYFAVGEGSPFGTDNLGLLVAGNALAGWFGSASWVLVPSMIADIAARDALRSGQQREGTFFGIYSLTHQASAGAAVLLTGLLVDRFAMLVPGQVEQSAETVRRIGLLFSVLPAGLLAIAAVLIGEYRLTRARVKGLREEAAAADASMPVPPPGRIAVESAWRSPDRPSPA